MPYLQYQVRSYLLSYPGMNALIGTKIYPGSHPPNPQYPVVVQRNIGGPRDSTHSGDSSLARIRMQFTTLSPVETKTTEIIHLIMSALSKYPGGAPEISGPIDDFNAETLVYSKSCDVMLWDKNPLP